MRTAIGAAVLTFYFVLTLAGGQDVISQKLNLTVSTVTWSLRVLAIALPLAVALVTYRLCRDLVGADHLEEEKEEIRREVEPVG